MQTRGFWQEHCHESVPEREARWIFQTTKQPAKTNPVNSVLIAEPLKAIPSEFAFQISLPPPAVMNKALNWQKTSIKEGTNSITDRHFEVSAEFQDHYLFNSGRKDSERVKKIGDKDTVNYLKAYSNLWLADGSFKICPLQF